MGIAWSSCRVLCLLPECTYTHNLIPFACSFSCVLSAKELVGHVCFVCVCIWPKITLFSNGGRVELVSCVVYHLSRRPWKVELLTGSMLAIVCAVGKEIDAFDNVDTEMTGWTHRRHFTCEKCTGLVRCPTDLKEMAATVHAGCY